MKRKKTKKINFKLWLGIISIVAFLGVFLNSVTGWQIDKWVDGTIYVIMGGALMIAGGIMMFFKYFKDGLTTKEINFVLTNIIGILSFLTGISIFIELQNPFFIGMRAIIAILAITIIGADLIGEKK